MPNMDSVRLLAPAKLNLVLRVGPRDPATGFHPLASWMCTVGLFDTLSIARSDGADVRFSCDNPSIPGDARNLVVKTVRVLLNMVGRDAEGLTIELQKRIPSAAGLGGGSSDAASTLVGLDRLLGLGLTHQQLCQAATELGSDVSFFLSPPSAWCTGRGEMCSELPAPARARWGLLIFPEEGLATAAVYRRFDELSLGRDEDLARPMDLHNWPKLESLQLLPLLVNDLEVPAFDLMPSLQKLRVAIEGLVQRPVRMSGSGSTLFTLYDDPEEAGAASGKMRLPASVRTAVVELAPDLHAASALSERPAHGPA